MPTNDRPRDESDRRRANRITALIDRLVKIRESHPRRRLINPIPQRVDEQPPCLRRTSRSGPHALIALRITMSIIERYAEDLAYCRVEV